MFAENFAHVAVTRWLRPVRHMALHHGHGEIGPQHHFAAIGVMRDIGPRADIFAIEIKQRISRQQMIGLKSHGARGLKCRKEPLRLRTNGRFLAHP